MFFKIKSVAFKAVSTSVGAFLDVTAVWATIFMGALSAGVAVLLAPTEVAVIHAWVEFQMTTKAVRALGLTLRIATFSIHAVLAA